METFGALPLTHFGQEYASLWEVESMETQQPIRPGSIIRPYASLWEVESMETKQFPLYVIYHFLYASLWEVESMETKLILHWKAHPIYVRFPLGSGINGNLLFYKLNIVLNMG